MTLAEQSALQAALSWLERADRSEPELRNYLERKGFGAAETAEALEKCRGYGYLDDEALANRVQSAMKRGLAGDLKILDRLEKRGLDAEVESSDAVQRALLALGRRFNGQESSADPKVWARAARHLAGKGYREEEICRALEMYFPGCEI